MWPFGTGQVAREPYMLELFPLKTVLFPGGRLSLKVFEQRYIEMTKQCVANQRPFGVCLITEGDEVAATKVATPKIASVGTLARITDWDMPEQGILHVVTQGEGRFQIRSHSAQPSGLVVGEVAAIPAEPLRPLADEYAPLARLLELIATRVGSQNFPSERDYGDASWVGYRLAEVLPLPLSIKQNMLEVNDSVVRLQVLQKFLSRQGLL